MKTVTDYDLKKVIKANAFFSMISDQLGNKI